MYLVDFFIGFAPFLFPFSTAPPSFRQMFMASIFLLFKALCLVGALFRTDLYLLIIYIHFFPILFFPIWEQSMGRAIAKRWTRTLIIEKHDI
jgi:hypothetical protein